jgi:hypothetical protein
MRNVFVSATAVSSYWQQVLQCGAKVCECMQELHLDLCHVGIRDFLIPPPPAFKSMNWGGGGKSQSPGLQTAFGTEHHELDSTEKQNSLLV